ncbi:MAG: hypothetical protein V4857_23495 [Pseudomonadota bacterium]
MSEYQYYEFAAIERPLTRDEIDELRSSSSRATISATRFRNEYNWGDLHVDPADWMRRFFDAFVYSANWRTCQFSLRLPKDALAERELMQFAGGDSCSATASDTHWIIDWSLDEGWDDERFCMEDGPGWMGQLAPLRDELLRGDLSALYLGWLASAALGDIDDDETEPDVPAGLSRLSSAQQSLVAFLEIDPDWLAAAAACSADAPDWNDDDSVETWTAGLSKNDMCSVFQLLLQGETQQAERRVKSEFLLWQKESKGDAASIVKPRTVAELRSAAATVESLRLEQEARAQALEDARRREQREATLMALMANVDQSWEAVERYVETGKPASYDLAISALASLADAYAFVSKKQEFDEALRLFVLRHAKRVGLMRRLVQAGLWRK